MYIYVYENTRKVFRARSQIERDATIELIGGEEDTFARPDASDFERI